jgi:hypothetical protein
VGFREDHPLTTYLGLTLQGIDLAWAILGANGLLKTITYVKVVRGTFNPRTGGGETTARSTFLAGLVDYQIEERAALDVQQARVKRLIARASDLPGYTPQIDDRVEDGVDVWTVHIVAGDPAIYWDLTLRI